MNSGLIQELFCGPIDILGDIHGEIDPLRDLFAHWDYDEGGVHPQGICVDFAVGAGCKERLVDATADHDCRLAAVQWPERELGFDHGVNIRLADG